MKVSKKNPLAIFSAVVGAIILIAVLVCATSDWRARRALKHQCGAGMDCVCFANVVDNRLTDAQVRAFTQFLKSVVTRPTTNILEFTDDVSAHEISMAINVCRPNTQPNQPNQKAKK